MHDQTEPIISDPNSTVGPFSWECDAGMTTSYMNTNRDIMTDPFSQMVSSIDTTDEAEVVDRKETAPEGAVIFTEMEANEAENIYALNDKVLVKELIWETFKRNE